MFLYYYWFIFEEKTMDRQIVITIGKEHVSFLPEIESRTKDYLIHKYPPETQLTLDWMEIKDWNMIFTPFEAMKLEDLFNTY